MADLVLKQAIAVIDGRTTVLCLNVAGQIRPEDQPFSTIAGDQDEPPFHGHCRTMVATWMPGMVSDQRKLANAELQTRPLKDRRRSPVQPPNASYVPPKTLDTPKTNVRPAPKVMSKDEYEARSDSWAAVAERDPDYEQGWLRGYTLQAAPVNAMLRGVAGVLAPKEEAFRKAIVRAFSRFFRHNAVEMGEETQVWRGVRTVEGLDPTAMMLVGGQYREKAWMSTSVDRARAMTFREVGEGDGWLFEVVVPADALIVFGKPSQYEVVLDRDSTFDVIGRDDVNKVVVLRLRTKGG